MRGVLRLLFTPSSKPVKRPACADPETSRWTPHHPQLQAPRAKSSKKQPCVSACGSRQLQLRPMETVARGKKPAPRAMRWFREKPVEEKIAAALLGAIVR
ncbi:hypothetical protein GUJ93_ZPchr0011g27224 [Zizania palustris]|uniref:Uncharacterized protein n=1 Tax=Zizania palustris TaxID=103762 RepID=A0A8J6BJ95_ZIZPA|nr:hypothetical protein GUJ93_ZPchr0011g27224 [Zizania palustris]